MDQSAMTDRVAEYASGADAIKRALMDEIGKAIDVIGALDDLSYRRNSQVSSSVGEQFRHNLDLINIFLRGVELGKIDYTRRERDVRVSRNRDHAIGRFETAVIGFALLDRSKMNGLVAVRSEVSASTWLTSSVAREMEFVLSHTIHHHALIAEKLERQGIATAGMLGVAPSTLSFWNRSAA